MPGAVRCWVKATGGGALMPWRRGSSAALIPHAVGQQRCQCTEPPEASKSQPPQIRINNNCPSPGDRGRAAQGTRLRSARGPRSTLGWRTTRRPARIAWRYWPEIELRTPGSFPVLILDYDSEPEDYLTVAFGSGLVCAPNWITHAASGHGHVV